MKGARACFKCNCTDAEACQTAQGPCFWIRTGPKPEDNLCSGCCTRKEFVCWVNAQLGKSRHNRPAGATTRRR